MKEKNITIFKYFLVLLVFSVFVIILINLNERNLKDTGPHVFGEDEIENNSETNNNYSEVIIEGPRYGGGGAPVSGVEVGTRWEIVGNDENSGVGNISFDNQEEIGLNKVEHKYYSSYETYGSFNIMNKITEFNYLFSAIIMLLFSLYILSISSNIWFKYNMSLKKKVLKDKLEFHISNHNVFIEKIDKINRIDDKYSKGKLNQFDKTILSIQKDISKIENEKNDFIIESFVYLVISAVLFSAYLFLLYLIKGLPGEFFVDELINYPLQFVSPFLLLSILFSLIAFVRFLLIQSGSEDKQMNKFSLFGIILVVVDLAACFITIYQFAI